MLAHKKNGFTIVELLIVIVVIGILASITIVAYSGIQSKARDTARTTDVKQVQKAIEMYYVDNGNYPTVASDNAGRPLSSLDSLLVPKYLAKLPNDPQTSVTNYQYVRGTVDSGAYGILVSYESIPDCHLGVKNEGIGWWSVSAC